MKWEYVLILSLFMAVPAMAQCGHFVDRAQAYILEGSPSGIHGAAQEYEHAAKCYDDEGKTTEAETYYRMAATNYVAAARGYEDGGDPSLKAGALEQAAESYVKIREYGLSVDYYNQAVSFLTKSESLGLLEKAGDKFANMGEADTAKSFYERAYDTASFLGDAERMSAISGKISSLNEGIPAGNMSVVIFWLTLFIILVIILVTTVLSISKGKQIRVQRKGQGPHSKHGQAANIGQHHITRRPEAAKDKPAPPHPDAKKSARERATEKLRKKYSSR